MVVAIFGGGPHTSPGPGWGSWIWQAAAASRRSGLANPAATARDPGQCPNLLLMPQENHNGISKTHSGPFCATHQDIAFLSGPKIPFRPNFTLAQKVGGQASSSSNKNAILYMSCPPPPCWQDCDSLCHIPAPPLEWRKCSSFFPVASSGNYGGSITTCITDCQCHQNTQSHIIQQLMAKAVAIKARKAFYPDCCYALLKCQTIEQHKCHS